MLTLAVTIRCTYISTNIGYCTLQRIVTIRTN
jgi:hypothetical protein